MVLFCCFLKVLFEEANDGKRKIHGNSRKITKRELWKKVKHLTHEIKNGKMTSREAKRYLAGHLGYIKIANVKNLKNKLFYYKNRTIGIN